MTTAEMLTAITDFITAYPVITAAMSVGAVIGLATFSMKRLVKSGR